jgi:hypothetical protein
MATARARKPVQSREIRSSWRWPVMNSHTPASDTAAKGTIM